MVCQPMVHGASGGGNLVCRLLRHLPFAITRFNLKTPGRDSEVASSSKKPLPVRRVNQVTTFLQS